MTDDGIEDIPNLSIHVYFNRSKVKFPYSFTLYNGGKLDLGGRGELENSSYLKTPKFRATRVKSFEDVIKKINLWIDGVNAMN